MKNLSGKTYTEKETKTFKLAISIAAVALIALIAWFDLGSLFLTWGIGGFLLILCGFYNMTSHYSLTKKWTEVEKSSLSADAVVTKAERDGYDCNCYPAYEILLKFTDSDGKEIEAPLECSPADFKHFKGYDPLTVYTVGKKVKVKYSETDHTVFYDEDNKLWSTGNAFIRMVFAEYAIALGLLFIISGTMLIPCYFRYV